MRFCEKLEKVPKNYENDQVALRIQHLIGTDARSSANYCAHCKIPGSKAAEKAEAMLTKASATHNNAENPQANDTHCSPSYGARPPAKLSRTTTRATRWHVNVRVLPARPVHFLFIYLSVGNAYFREVPRVINLGSRRGGEFVSCLCATWAIRVTAARGQSAGKK